MPIFGKWFGKGDHAKNDGTPMSHRALAERYAEVLRQGFPGGKVVVKYADSAGQTSVHLQAANGFKSSQFMGNIYRRYQQAPLELDALLAEGVAQAEAANRSFDSTAIDATRLLPVIKTQNWLAASASQLQTANMADAIAHLLIRPLASDLLLVYVEDTADSMSYLREDALARLGLDLEQLHDKALHNLQEMLPQLELAGGGGRYAARLDRNYDASMVLLLEQWRPRIELAGEPVLAIPARDELLVCGNDDGEAIASLREMAREIAAGSAYALSTQLFVWRDDRLQVYAS